jgi:feruloyl esterase
MFGSGIRGTTAVRIVAKVGLVILLAAFFVACAGESPETGEGSARSAAATTGAAEKGEETSKRTGTDAEHCGSIAGLNLETIPGAPTRISSAEIVDATDQLPEHCRVRGYVSPKVRFELQLPTRGDWNGNFLFGGCGGLCGSVDPTNCGDALPRGYAAATTDTGHEGIDYLGLGPGGEVVDTLWAYGDEAAVVDFAHRGVHVATVATKTLTEAFYEDKIGYSYFVGCSQGGRQAMVEAQRYPEDFDGILARDPGLDYRAVQLDWTWAANTNLDDNGKPIITAEDVSLIQEAVMDSCDRVDGLEDGLIDDPRRCEFDPEALRCEEGDSGDCLTEQQVETLRRLYGPPVNSRGRAVSTGGLLHGSEGEWVEAITGTDELPSVAKILGDDLLRYLSFDEDPGPDYDPRTFDFDKDPAKMGESFELLGATDPDLSSFRDAGGKLILVRGWADGQLSPASTVTYYERAVERMGGSEATQEFFRLFMVPGKNHCAGDTFGGPPEVLTVLEDWVERGVAPDRLEVEYQDEDGNAARTRPVFPYPLVARYDGSGSIDEASNFESAEPE